jgi:ATP-dependent Clp protease ATP-binding subunit ClpX
MLAQILDVPFSMSDCTTFTQAGYIGEDADVSVQRLLAAADWDVSRAEYGIIYLDEVDKLATAKVVNGKDVSGEGVQQALLKIIEGTTLTITNKSERGSQRHAGSINYRTGFDQQNSMAPLHPARPETYTIRTDNILFIFSGAFVGLQKIILDRVSRGSIGFGANIRSNTNSNNPISLPASDYNLFRKHRPFFSSTDEAAKEYNPLELASPVDFQKYGLIPEFIGRIPITTALSALTLQELTRILTEPHNSLVQQYTATFALSGAELYISTSALHVIAQEGLRMGTGARGLRAAMESLLWQPNYEVPGTGIRYVLVTERVALREEEVHYWPRSGALAFRRARDREEEAWRERQNKNTEYKGAALEDYRKRAESGRTQMG